VSAELQPGELEVLQAEPITDPPIRVKVTEIDAPIRTQSLPRKSGGTRTRTIGTTVGKVLSADHRRAQATVISIGQNMLFALNSASAQDPSTMALWPQNVPYVLTADTELYVASATGTTSISIITEFWAAGD